MNTQHAPGPWSVGPYYTIYDESGGPIAQVSRACCESADEARATARLIAAAPELLAALLEIAGEFVDGNERATYRRVSDAMDKIRATSRAAIKKVEA